MEVIGLIFPGLYLFFCYSKNNSFILIKEKYNGTRSFTCKKIKKPELVFKTKEEWRKSAIKNGYAGLAINEIRLQKGKEATEWYKAFKNWLDFNVISITIQKQIKAFVLAEKEKG